jgi:hypothetical protein
LIWDDLVTVVDDAARFRRRLLDGFVTDFSSRAIRFGHVIGFVDIIQQRGLQRGLVKMGLFFDPGQVLLGPALFTVSGERLP